MTEQEVLKLWKQGYSKYKVAQIYQTRYNEQIKIIRLNVKHRHSRTIYK